MKGLLVLLIAGVICSLSAGSYSYSKANKCRSECRRDEHCVYEGFVCEPTMCQGKKIKRCLKASGVPKPDVMVPLTTGVLRGNVDPRDGIVPGDIINVKTGGGHIVDTGIPPLNVDTGFQNVGILPVVPSDVIKVKPGSPQVMPIGPVTGFNDVSGIDMCVDNCAENSRCLGDKDCILGCKQLCENDKSLINIQIDTNLPFPDTLTTKGQNNDHLSNILHGSNSDINIGLPMDPMVRINSGGFPIGIDSTFPVKPIDMAIKQELSGEKGTSFGVHAGIGNPFLVDPINQKTQTDVFGTGQFHLNPVNQPFAVTSIDGLYPTRGMAGKTDFVSGQHMNTKSDLPSGAVSKIHRGIQQIDTGFPSDIGLVNQGGLFVPVEPTLEADQLSNLKAALPADTVGHFTKVGQNAARFKPLVPVNSAKSNFPHGIPGHNFGMVVRPLLPLVNVGEVGQVGSITPVVDAIMGSKRNQHVLVDTNGQMQHIDSTFGTAHGNSDFETGKVVPLPIPTNPLKPLSPGIDKKTMY